MEPTSLGFRGRCSRSIASAFASLVGARAHFVTAAMCFCRSTAPAKTMEIRLSTAKRPGAAHRAFCCAPGAIGRWRTTRPERSGRRCRRDRRSGLSWRGSLPDRRFSQSMPGGGKGCLSGRGKRLGGPLDKYPKGVYSQNTPLGYRGRDPCRRHGSVFAPAAPQAPRHGAARLDADPRSPRGTVRIRSGDTTVGRPRPWRN